MSLRIIMAATQPELISKLKTDLTKLPCVETVIQVTRVIDLENKLSRTINNVALVDLDEAPDLGRLQTIKRRFHLHTICISSRAMSATIALHNGGDDFVLKPVVVTPLSAQRFSESIAKLVVTYADRNKAPQMRDLIKMVSKSDRQIILAIASSTGGTNALEEIIKGLPADIPPTVVVQHMSSGFTKLFADRLNANYPQKIKEAATGDYLMRGTLLLAPADRHMKLIRRGDKLAVECFVGPKMHGVMPAADILFESVAELAKADAIGVVLTGMGADGARGLKQMRSAGATTIGQDEATCVVYGMPKVAKDLGAITHELPLGMIAPKIIELTSNK